MKGLIMGLGLFAITALSLPLLALMVLLLRYAGILVIIPMLSVLLRDGAKTHVFDECAEEVALRRVCHET